MRKFQLIKDSDTLKYLEVVDHFTDKLAFVINIFWNFTFFIFFVLLNLVMGPLNNQDLNSATLEKLLQINALAKPYENMGVGIQIVLIVGIICFVVSLLVSLMRLYYAYKLDAGRMSAIKGIIGDLMNVVLFVLLASMVSYGSAFYGNLAQLVAK